MDPKALKKIRKAEKAEREFRKKFKVWQEPWEGWGQSSCPRPLGLVGGVGCQHSQRSNMPPRQFEGEIVIQTKMMIDPNAKTRRGGGKHLGIRRGEILEVIEFTNKEEMLCRDTKGKCELTGLADWGDGPYLHCQTKNSPIPALSADGYVPRTALLPL